MHYTCLVNDTTTSIKQSLENATANGFTAISIPLINPIHYYESGNPVELSFSRPDLILPADQWAHKIIPILPSNLNCDSEDGEMRKLSEQALLHHISWINHLQNAGYMMMSIKDGGKVTNLARIITRNIKGLLLVRVPFLDPQLDAGIWNSELKVSEMESIAQDTWHWWNNFRMATDFHSKIRVVLELSEDIPSPEQISRWLGEPVEALLIPSSIFLRNRSNYPVLSKAWQEIVVKFLINNANIFISAPETEPGLQYYADYLNNLRVRNVTKDPMHGLEDMLEIPLQPLHDNLDAYTYEIFEKDPIKYKAYQDAIELALRDKVPEEEISKKTVIIMVLGAGRGPLVRSALNAAAKANRKVRIYIIEKNPNALNTLNALKQQLWADKDIHIFHKDMRDFSPPEKGDIIVSELLGSFGDNELSPECLDCTLKLLKDDGISIPCKSTSYLNPVMSPKLLNCIRGIDKLQTFREKQSTYLTNAETAYVVLFKNVYHISKPQDVFEFHHPNREEIVDNSRHKTLTFEVSQDCVMTGFAGYFDTVLYKDITLSINPLTHTVGMASWFPMYFPITTPRQLKAGEKISCDFWRCIGPHEVWYEWSVSEPFITHVHNFNHRACSIYKL